MIIQGFWNSMFSLLASFYLHNPIIYRIFAAELWSY